MTYHQVKYCENWVHYSRCLTSVSSKSDVVSGRDSFAPRFVDDFEDEEIIFNT